MVTNTNISEMSETLAVVRFHKKREDSKIIGETNQLGCLNRTTVLIERSKEKTFKKL